MENKFFICKHCGNIVGLIRNGGGKLVCCGEEMQPLIANTVEASREKHLPVVEIEGSKVKVTIGSVLHPMIQEHKIEWVYLETDKGGQRKALEVPQKPYVEFNIGDEKPVAVYAYCNLHGLWKTVL